MCLKIHIFVNLLMLMLIVEDCRYEYLIDGNVKVPNSALTSSSNFDAIHNAANSKMFTGSM